MAQKACISIANLINDVGENEFTHVIWEVDYVHDIIEEMKNDISGAEENLVDNTIGEFSLPSLKEQEKALSVVTCVLQFSNICSSAIFSALRGVKLSLRVPKTVFFCPLDYYW